MKLIIALSVVVIASNALSTEEQWFQFKVEHSKTYANPDEEELRFNIFKENLRKIEEHNVKYNNGEVTYYKAINQFGDITQEEFAALFSSKPTWPKTQKIKSKHTSIPESSLDYPDWPESIDWRELGAVTPVQDQKLCGSCWAFSAAGSLEGQRHIKDNILEPLSVQQLIDCSKDYGNYGCEGGTTKLALIYVRFNGICTDAEYPYLYEDRFECPNCTSVITKLSGFHELEQKESDLQYRVGNVGPVAAAVNANFEWQFYKGGIFDHWLCSSDADSLNHGVLVVGYDSEDGKDYWIIKNSWGTRWGEKGYMRLVRGKEQCGVHKLAIYPIL